MDNEQGRGKSAQPFPWGIRSLVGIQRLDGRAFVNILDLQDQRLPWSAPASQMSNLSWSPASAHLTYQDDMSNWQLVDVQRQTTFALTLNGGSWVYIQQWSFDGRYLRLAACGSYSEYGCNYQTAIFDTTSAQSPASP